MSAFPNNAFLKLWGMPVLLGVLTAGGLVAGLLGDGWWDLAALAGLGLPLLVAVWHIARSA
jgi:hypothetical protein